MVTHDSLEIIALSEPRIFYDKDGSQVIMYSNAVARGLVAKGELFTSPPEPPAPKPRSTVTKRK